MLYGVVLVSAIHQHELAVSEYVPSLLNLPPGQWCSVLQSYQTLCDHMDCSSPGFSAHGNFPGKNIGVGSHFLLQGIFQTHGSGQLFKIANNFSVSCREPTHETLPLKRP